MQNMVLKSELRWECERSQRPGDETLRQWVKTEHYRLHCAEGWPDSPHKEAVLAAARSVLERLEAATIEPFESRFAWFVLQGEIRTGTSSCSGPCRKPLPSS